MTRKAILKSPRPMVKKEVRRNKNTKKKQRNNRRELNEKERPTEMSRLLVLYYTQGLKPLPQECKAQEIPPMARGKSQKEERINGNVLGKKVSML